MSKKPSSWKKQKRQLKLERRQEKNERKRTRREEKAARKLAIKQQRETVMYRSLLDRSQAIELIEKLLEGVKSGRISLERGEEQLSMTPADVVDVRVRGRQSHKSESLAIRVRWPRTQTSEETAELKVMS